MWPGAKRPYACTGSYDFDGVSQYFSNNTFFFGNQFSLNNNQQFTLSIWIKPDDITTHQNILSKWRWINSTNAVGWFLDLKYPGTGDGILYFSMQKDYIARLSCLTTTPLVAGNWYHIVVTHNGSANSILAEPKIYINSVLDSTILNTAPANHGTIQHTVNFYMGARQYSSGSPSIFYNGKMTEFGYWAALTMGQAQITELYNGGTPMDLEEHSAYAQQIFSQAIGKWIPLNEREDHLYNRQINALTVDWERSVVGMGNYSNLWSAAVNNSYLIQNVGPTKSFDRPGRL